MKNKSALFQFWLSPLNNKNNISLRYGDCVKCLSNYDYIAAVLGRKDNVQRKYLSLNSGMTRYEKVLHVFFIFIPLMWKCHGIGNDLMFHTNYCGLAPHHNLLKHLIHILCSLSFVLEIVWGDEGGVDFSDTFVAYSICTTSSWSISDRKLWADIWNAVYLRRGLTCIYGITNNLIHVCRWSPSEG